MGIGIEKGLRGCVGEAVDENVNLIVKALRVSMKATQRNPVSFPYMGRLVLQKSISVASVLTELYDEREHMDQWILNF